MTSVVLAAASVDCERMAGGLLTQPANSVSSLAFVVAGVWILVRARHHNRNRDAIAIGLAAVAVGVGSVAFHAVSSSTAHWLHDATLLFLLGLVAVRHVGLRALSLSRAAPAVCIVAGAVVLGFRDSTTLVAIALVICVAASELAATWRNRARLIPPSLATMVAFGLFASWLGRDGSPLCRPDSVLQLHAVWHLVMAAATAWWANCAVFAGLTARDVDTARVAGGVAVPAPR
jgi:hypothetical protein